MALGGEIGCGRVVGAIARPDRGPAQRPTANIVFPTPGGPMKRTFMASSKNRNVASSSIILRSTDGWASKSKSSTRHGADRRPKRSRPAWCRACEFRAIPYTRSDRIRTPIPTFSYTR